MWFLLSLVFALGSSFGVSINKKVLRNTHPLVFIVFGMAINAIGNGLFTVFVIGLSSVDLIFWQNILIASFLGIFVNVFYMTGIKLSPISLSAPMAAVTPLVATLSGFVYLSEIASPQKLIGIIFIVIGSYFLSISQVQKGILEPFKALFSQKGVLFMLLAQGLVGITPAFEKTAILHTTPRNPLMTAWIEVVLVTVFLLPFMLALTKKPFQQFRANKWWYIFPLPLAVFLQWAAFTAYSLNNIGYVTAVFKLSILFTIIWGGLFFKEKNIGERFLGSSIMVFGTILLAI